MTAEVKAQWVSSDLLFEVRNKSYPIHSVFPSGINIRLEEKLCFIGNKEDMKLPYGVLIGQKDLPALHSLRHKEMTNLIWDGTKKIFLHPKGTISFGDAPVFTCDIPKQSKRITWEDAAMLRNAAEDSWMTGFDISLREIKGGKWDLVSRLYPYFHKTREECIQGLKLWVGRGIGLTPSGDDFLIGILYANRLADILGGPFLEAVSELVRAGYTTDVSIHFYRCAMEGKFNCVLLDLANALSMGDFRGVKAAVRMIGGFGHTSGKDMIAGMLSGFQYAAAADRQEKGVGE